MCENIVHQSVSATCQLSVCQQCQCIIKARPTVSVGDSALLMLYTQSIERQGSGGQYQTWTHMSSVTGPLVAGFVRKQSIRRYKLELDMWKSLCKTGPHVDWGPAHCAGQVKKTSVFVGRKHFDPGEAAAQMDRPGLRVGCHPGVGADQNQLYISKAPSLLWLQAAA